MKRLVMYRPFFAATIIIVALSTTSCFFKSNTTTMRGRVTYDQKPVSGAEVRFSGKNGEQVTRTDLDGRYNITLTQSPKDPIEIKVLWPGYTHDEIKFSSIPLGDNPIDIELKKIFTPTAPKR